MCHEDVRTNVAKMKIHSCVRPMKRNPQFAVHLWPDQDTMIWQLSELKYRLTLQKDANMDKCSVLHERIVSCLMILPVTGGSPVTYFIIHQDFSSD